MRSCRGQVKEGKNWLEINKGRYILRKEKKRSEIGLCKVKEREFKVI